MNENFRQAGFNITGSSLQVVEAVNIENKFKVVNLNEVFFSQNINFETEKDTIITAQLQSAFDELQLTNPIKATSVSFTLPAEVFIILQLPIDGTLLQSDLQEELSWELSLLYPFIRTDDLAIQYHEIRRDTAITNTPGRKALVIALNKKYIRLLKEFCKRNSLSLRFIDCAPLAANRTLSLSEYPSKEGITLNIHSSMNSACIIFSNKMRLIQIETISKNKNADFAEKISQNLFFAPEKKISKEIITEAYINGNDLSEELLSMLFEKTGLIFHIFNPFHQSGLEQELLNKYQSKEKLNSFAPAAGVAFRLT